MHKQANNNSNHDTYVDLLLDAINVGFILCEVVYDTDGKASDFSIIKANQVLEEMLGIKADYAAGKQISRLFPDMQREWIEIFRYGSSYGGEIRINFKGNKDNRKFRADVVNLPHGKIAMLVADITPELKAEEALKKHSLLFENAHDIILYLKADGSIIDANKTAAVNYGYTREELLQMKVQFLRHPSTLKDFDEQMKSSQATGVIFECVHVKKDGTSFPVEVSSRTVLINDEWLQIHIVRDITRRKAAEEQIKYLVNNDPLTGLCNRRCLTEQFEKELLQTQRSGGKCAVMLSDVDNFKAINDIYGHNAGDEVLRKVSKRFLKSVRLSDFAGRWGGDEFLIIQPNIRNKDDAARLAQRILDAVAKPVEWEGMNIPVNISIGISIFPKDAADSQGLVHCADEAMYSAKQRGGMGYAFYS